MDIKTILILLGKLCSIICFICMLLLHFYVRLRTKRWIWILESHDPAITEKRETIVKNILKCACVIGVIAFGYGVNL